MLSFAAAARRAVAALVIAVSVAVSVTASPCLTQAEADAYLLEAIGTAGFDLVYDFQTGTMTANSLNMDFGLISLGGDNDGCAPVYSNAMVTRDFPRGRTATLSAPADGLNVADVDFRWWDYDRFDTNSTAVWNAPPILNYFGPVNTAPLPGPSVKFMSAHPASSFKLMVATGAMLALDTLNWSDAVLDGIITFNDTLIVGEPDSERVYWNSTVREALRNMIAYSDNEATAACVKFLHQTGVLPHRLSATFGSLGLTTLHFNGTYPSGQWGVTPNNRSSEQDTTGYFTMTAWDAARLLWLIHPNPPSSATPNWMVAGAPVNTAFLSLRAKQYLMYELLANQQLHECMSTTVHCGFTPSVVQNGIKSQVPAIYVNAQNGVRYHERATDPPLSGDPVLTNDITPCQAATDVLMYHKTGLTKTFGSNVAIVHAIDGSRQFILTVFGNAGQRYTDAALAALSSTPCPTLGVCYPSAIPRAAAAVDCALRTGFSCINPPANDSGGSDAGPFLSTFVVVLIAIGSCALLVLFGCVWWSANADSRRLRSARMQQREQLAESAKGFVSVRGTHYPNAPESIGAGGAVGVTVNSLPPATGNAVLPAAGRDTGAKDPMAYQQLNN